MALLCSLIHRAAVYRPTKSINAIRQELLDYPPTPTSDAVPCRLYAQVTEAMQRQWGKDLQIGGVVQFAGGTDIRPKLSSTEGLGDKLVITDQDGNSLGTWHVVGVQDPAATARVTVAAVKKWGT